MTFPIFYLAGGGQVYDGMNMLFSIIVIAILGILFVLSALEAASESKSHEERVFAGRIGLACIVGVIVLTLFGFVPTFVVVVALFVLVLILNVVTSAFGHPLV